MPPARPVTGTYDPNPDVLLGPSAHCALSQLLTGARSLRVFRRGLGGTKGTRGGEGVPTLYMQVTGGDPRKRREGSRVLEETRWGAPEIPPNRRQVARRCGSRWPASLGGAAPQESPLRRPSGKSVVSMALEGAGRKLINGVSAEPGPVPSLLLGGPRVTIPSPTDLLPAREAPAGPGVSSQNAPGGASEGHSGGSGGRGRKDTVLGFAGGVTEGPSQARGGVGGCHPGLSPRGRAGPPRWLFPHRSGPLDPLSR